MAAKILWRPHSFAPLSCTRQSPRPLTAASEVPVPVLQQADALWQAGQPQLSRPLVAFASARTDFIIV
jgi:hypothetical protein